MMIRLNNGAVTNGKSTTLTNESCTLSASPSIFHEWVQSMIFNISSGRGAGSSEIKSRNNMGAWIVFIFMRKKRIEMKQTEFEEV